MQPADNGKRFLAFVLDSFIISAISNIISIPISICSIFLLIPLIAASESDGGEAIFAMSFILLMCCVSLIIIFVSLAITYFYYVWFPVKRWNGQTVGKNVLKIKIVKEDGAQVNQWDLFMREFIGKFISGIIFYLGYIWILIDDRKQGWHDKIANTLVIEAETDTRFQ